MPSKRTQLHSSTDSGASLTAKNFRLTRRCCERSSGATSVVSSNGGKTWEMSCGKARSVAALIHSQFSTIVGQTLPFEACVMTYSYHSMRSKPWDFEALRGGELTALNAQFTMQQLSSSPMRV